MSGITPTSTTSRPRQDLLGAYYEFNPQAGGLVADQVAPSFDVIKRTGTFGVIPRETWMQRVNTKRAPKAETSESGFGIESDNFQLVEYAHKGFTDEVEAENFEDWVDAEEVETQRVARTIEMDREFDVAAAYFNETTFPAAGTTGVTLVTPWDAAAATPLDEFNTGRLAIQDNYGVDPNTLIITTYTYVKFSLVTQIKNALTDTYGPTKPGLIPLDKLKAIFGIDQIIVAGGMYNTANEGQNGSFSRIWNDDYAWLGRIEGGKDLKAPQAARWFRYKGKDVNIDSWQQNDPPGTWVRARRHGVVKMMATPVGYLFKNTKT
jgi:hypothetical protein